MKTFFRASVAKAGLPVFLSAILAAWSGGQSSLSAQSEGRPAAALEQLLKPPDVRKGLCVHVGCGDGKLTAQMCQGGKFIVHGIDPDSANIQKARQYIQSKGIYGPVSVECRPADRLPYTHDTVNVLIVDRLDEMLGKGFNIAEAMRVLAPYGVAFFGGGLDENALKAKLTEAGVKDFSIVQADGAWAKVTKPYPAEMDQWQQHRHDASRAAISKDKLVGPVTGIRWIQGELWSNLFRPVNSILSSNGRNFYLKAPEPGDAGKVYRLEARDAFNGLKLWERPVQAMTNKVLSAVAIADKVYVNLAAKSDSPISLAALDAATGEIVKIYETQGELTHYKGCLIVREKPELWTVWDPVKGDKLRTFAVKKAHGNAPIIIADDQVFVTDANAEASENTDAPKSAVVCLDFSTAKEKWRTPNLGDGEPFWCNRGILLTEPVAKSWGAKDIHAFSTVDGKHLWKYPSCSKKGNFVSAFIMGDVLWTYDQLPITDAGKYGSDDSAAGEKFKKNTGYIGLDPATGQKTKFDLGWCKEFGRCGPDSATERYIMGMSMAVYDFLKMESYGCYIARGDCGINNTSANGLTYQYGHQCACSSYVCGVMGLSSDPLASADEMKARAGEPLEKGPAYGAAIQSEPPSPTDWPTYRHDAFRSGATAATVPAELKVLWKVKAGSRVSSPVAASGMVFVSAIDEHKVLALDAKTGDTRWTFTAGGRVDTPPTFHAGMLLFGSQDGYVYCLKAASGELVWRFRAAPEDRRIVARDRVESVWPLNGTVLVENGVAYLAAGRHCDADGGVFFHALEPATGKILWEKRIAGFPPYRTDPHQKTIASRLVKDPQKYDSLSASDKDLLTGYEKCTYNDVLISDGGTIFLGAICIDIGTRKELPISPAAALYGGGGTFLCDNSRPGYGGDRNQWAFIGDTWRKNKAVSLTSGNGLAIDERKIYGIRQGDEKGKTLGMVYALTRQGIAAPQGDTQPSQPAAKGWQKTDKDKLRMKAILVANDKVFVACQPDGIKFGSGNAKVGEIRIYSAQTGEKLGQFDLSAEPAFDGLAATEGRLLVSMQDGEIICLSDYE
ncbi:MAG: PQQ-binding-like beta-propeller repeat protein [Planctomycetes bacterium]|nr:PQQ-binding-like beta-propeller repeat protein [Planctomycetota bacterium]